MLIGNSIGGVFMKKVILFGCKAVFILFMFSAGTFLSHPRNCFGLILDLMTSIKKSVLLIEKMIVVFHNYLINFL